MESLLVLCRIGTGLRSRRQTGARTGKEFTVSEISAEIKRFVETKFSRIRIRGEIFGCKRADSGHWYLSLER
ncbi:MAG: exodeoxyribonuclease VII large subunit [Alphaproteobacteria bacterium]